MLFTKGDATFSFDLSHFSVEQLRDKAYHHELCEEDATYIILDAFQSGCGSNSCGPVLDPAYQLKAGKHRFSFDLIPCRDGEIRF